MSTRAVYTFMDNDDEYHVYKHFDGYPEGAAQWIENALPYAWKTRFEASEFACAFIAANKKENTQGDVYLSCGPTNHGDLEYRYEITSHEKQIMVKAFKIDIATGNEKEIFYGTLKDFKAKNTHKGD